MAVDPKNKKQVGRLLRRIPIALVILYLFLSSMLASSALGLGFLIVAVLVLVTVLAWVLKLKGYARVMKYPVYYYMGRNNFLYAWLVVFAIASTVFAARTDPEPVQPLPPSVVETPKTPRTRAELDIQEDLASIRENEEKFANHRQHRGYVTNAQLAVVERNLDENRWTIPDRRFNYTTMLWLLVLLYLPFAVADEFKAAFVAVAERWATQPEAYERPAFYESIRKWTGGKAPVWTAAAAGTATAVHKAQGFWVQVLQEALAQKIVDIPTILRRR